ncbi:hypothetical protein PNEG_00069 [Pneumocystis murina B123]|uniref:Nucleolar 27S pre-rRNA processing Urb2/Npa2 C-terminal domain-containing protein n=1 Tax=Pneumocystis murina (strain B123) TaxID=1069680 RepID=M7PCJ6_PNEMU|nr:hypothetical protein PNEG_00069 [Pneumocystis murina B123]EMR11630.1 hypothetical protein PNEG_00069 [Pneumocystis murina B123]
MTNDIPVRSTQEVTRFLRNKSETLENKLKTANDLLNGNINIYFPQKENFLLNWVLDKLKEIIPNEKNSLKVISELWEFLRNVLESKDLLAESKYFNFQKHSFTTLLSITMSFAAKVKEKKLLSLISSITKTIDYILSEGTLFFFIKGSFDTTTTILADFFCCIKDLNLYNDTISILGSQIFGIWEKSIYGLENFKKVSKTISSKVLPHACYLIGKKDTPSWLNDLFSTVLYKTLFSPELLIDYINDQIQNSKSRNIALKESSLELFFNSLLNNLPKTSHFNILSSLPKFLEIAQNSVSYNSVYSKVKINVNPSKMMQLNDIFLSEILKFVFKLSLEQKTFKYSIILNILEVSKDNSISHKVSNIILEQQISEIFKDSFLLIKEDNTMMIGWKLLYTLLKFNFELILPYNEQLWTNLTQIDMTSEYSEICYELIKLFVNNYKMQRNLHEFINNWMKFLNFSLINNCILLSDEILIIVMGSANTLPLNKIKAIINYILEENNFEVLKKSVDSNELSLKNSLDISKNQIKSPFFVFYPLLSILHGLTDTEIISDIWKDMVKLYKSIIIEVFSNISTFLEDHGIHLIFRIHYKTMLLSHEYISSTDPYKNLEYIRSISNFKRISPKIFFYMIQCQLFYLQYFDQGYSENFKTENRLLLMDSILDDIIFFLRSTSINSLWKAGKMQLINKDNISIAYIYAINNNWLYLINKLCSFDKIKKFMNIFIKYSVESSLEVNISQLLSFSNLWYIFLSNAEIYELALLRDASLSAFTDYIFSYEFDQILFQDSIKSYSNKKHKNLIEDNKDDFDILKFRKIIKYLQIIPINCIKDSVKEKLLDFLFYIDFQFIKRYSMNIVLDESRKLLYRIMMTINTLNSLLYNIFSLVYFCVSLDNIKVKEESLISISSLISKEIIRKKIFSDNSLADKLIKIIKKYEINLLDYYHAFLYQQTENTFYIPGIIQLISIFFFEIQNNDKIHKKEFLKEEITKLMHFYFETIEKCLKKLLEICQKNTSNLEKALNSIYLFQLFFKLSFFFSEYDKDSLKQLIFLMSTCCFYYENINIYLYEKSQDLLLSLLKIHCNKIRSHDDILETSIVLITAFKNIQLSLTDIPKISTYYNFESLSIYCFIQQKSQSLKFQDFERICKVLCLSSWKVENINMAANILCAILLSRIEEVDESKKKYLELFQTFVSCLISVAKRAKDLEILYNFINLFNILLYKKSQYFSLQNLDQLFVLITITLSSSSPILNLSPNITIDDICKRFCKMISLILKKNYKKLNGRYHLLTNCFQSLLYLFAHDNTNTKITKNSFFHRIPNWILTSSCSISTAKIYSDSLLCWIQTSHSNKSSKKLKLNSFKTSEKAIAKYLLWIIVEYIKLLLNYSINSEIKVILTSSIMEIFKLLSTHELRMINNALDSQGKIVFKKLYSNYTQYDKWDET